MFKMDSKTALMLAALCGTAMVNAASISSNSSEDIIPEESANSAFTQMLRPNFDGFEERVLRGLADIYNDWDNLMNGTDEPVSLSLQPSAMNEYYAVQAIKAVKDEQQSNLELDERERNCIDIIKRASDFVACRRELKNQKIAQFWDVIDQIMTKLQEKGYLSDDCQWRMPGRNTDESAKEAQKDTRAEEEVEGYTRTVTERGYTREEAGREDEVD